MKLISNFLTREPVLIAAAVIAVLNLVLGKDSGLSVDTVTTVLTLLVGLVARKQVVPVKQKQVATSD